MSDVSMVSQAQPEPPPVENQPVSGTQGLSPGGGVSSVHTMAELEVVAKPLADAIKYALATNICSASKRSNDRMKEALRKGQREGT